MSSSPLWRSFVSVLRDGVRGTLDSFRPRSPGTIRGLNNTAFGWIATGVMAVGSILFLLFSSTDRLYFALGAVGFGAASIATLFVTGLASLDCSSERPDGGL